MGRPEFGSILLGTTDPERLRAWYAAAFEPETDVDGWLRFGPVGILVDRRDDVSAKNPEPGRVIVNLHVSDARALAERLDRLAVTWLVEPEQRADGWFATIIDPDGNYVQIIELNDDYLARRSDRDSREG